MHTPWNILLRKTWVGNIYSNMVICRKLADVRPIITSVITITLESDDIPWSPEWWEGEGLVQDLYPLLPTPSTFYPTFSKEEWFISLVLPPCLLIIPLLSPLWEEEWLVWYLYTTTPSPPILYPEKFNNLSSSRWFGGDSGCLETYIHLYLQHQLLPPNC